VQSIGRDDRVVVVEGGSAARYLPSGHLVYARGTSLFAVAFDPAARAVRGGPVPMVEGLRRSSNGVSDAANFAVSATGTLAMIPRDRSAGAQDGMVTSLTWVDRDGREEPFPVPPDDYTRVRISPDRNKVALVIGSAVQRPTRPAIWIFDRQTGNLSELTATAEGDDGPVWSPDGRRIFFRSFRDKVGVYAIEVDTSGTTLLAAASPDEGFPQPLTISPDGRVLGLLSRRGTLGGGGGLNIATLPVTGGKLAPLLDTAAYEAEPAISPNGDWLAYVERTAGAAKEINLRPFPAVSRRRILVDQGDTPVFSRDGSELFFAVDEGLMAAPITYEPTLRVGTPRLLFPFAGRYMWEFYGRVWDVDPNDGRFLMVRVPGSAAARGEPVQERIDVVLNWVEELKSRVPVE
jgi:hypothetical protein